MKKNGRRIKKMKIRIKIKNGQLKPKAKIYKNG